jgi:hypothetical protein
VAGMMAPKLAKVNAATAIFLNMGFSFFLLSLEVFLFLPGRSMGPIPVLACAKNSGFM